ncbi:MAG: sugar ABC transporter permease [Treponema sp.]|jgi:multiple sugar transport system permease protein|nr:sugar ABC transporter permease [Treponema sp.]
MEKESTKKSTAKRARRDGVFIFVMLLPSLVLVVMFAYYPVLRGIPMAFQKYSLWDLYNTPFVGFANFRNLFSRPDFLLSLPNTVKWVAFSLAGQFILGFTLAMFLRKKFAGRGVYQGAVFFPWAISGFLIGILWRWLYNGSYGVINGILIRFGFVDIANPIGFLSNKTYAMGSCIVANIWYGIAFFAIMIQAALQGVPEELYEAAEVDGAGKVRQFFAITLPFIKSILSLVVLLRVIWIFNFADLIYALTRGGPGGSTEIMTSLQLNLVMFGNDYGLAASMGIILTLVMAVFTVLYLFTTRKTRLQEV